MYNETDKLLYNMLITQGTNLLVEILPNTKTFWSHLALNTKMKNQKRKKIMKPDQ